MNDLSTLLRERLADVHHPDLAGLATGAIDRGRMLQRRRRMRYAALTVAAAACVAGVAVGTASFGGGTSSATELQSAAAGQHLDVSQPGPTPSAIGLDLSSSHAPKSVPVGPGPLEPAESGRPHALPGVAVPFSIRLEGWTCGTPGDQKEICSGPGGRRVVVTWRRSADYRQWIASPDKGAAPDVVTTAPHGAWFASVMGDQQTSSTDLHALADAITWQ